MVHSVSKDIIAAGAVYQMYDFEKKYGDVNPEHYVLLRMFNTKLEQCLEKMRKEDGLGQEGCAALYEEQAIELRNFIYEADWSTRKEGELVGIPWIREVLARSIQCFDDVLENKQNDDNSKQLLILARDVGKRARNEKVEAALYHFVSITTVVLAIAFVGPTSGASLFLLFGTLLAESKAIPATGKGIQFEKQHQQLSSFTEKGRGFFSSVPDQNVPQSKDEQYDVDFDGDDDKSGHHKNE
ncbi:MAG: hypothetical protein K0U37_09070 [Gammaproteobacteria bacterium]|nr:hypothetical protein [Gammaproteobacteria bacterium]